MFRSLLDIMRRSAELPVPFTGIAGTMPVMDLADHGTYLLLKANLPGIDPRSVQVQVTETSLFISGYGTREERTEGPDFIRMQSAVGSFYQEMPLPAPINPHRAALEWKQDGSLHVVLPKR